MRPLASTPSKICKERVFSQVATFLPFLLVFQGFLPLLAHSLRIPWALEPLSFNDGMKAAFLVRGRAGRLSPGQRWSFRFWSAQKEESCSTFDNQIVFVGSRVNRSLW
jgi:hypothetical protein